MTKTETKFKIFHTSSKSLTTTGGGRIDGFGVHHDRNTPLAIVQAHHKRKAKARTHRYHGVFCFFLLPSPKALSKISKGFFPASRRISTRGMLAAVFIHQSINQSINQLVCFDVLLSPLVNWESWIYADGVGSDLISNIHIKYIYVQSKVR
jgi:hypothetical protein